MKVIPKGDWFSKFTDIEKALGSLKRALNVMKVLELTYIAEEKR